LGYEVGAADLCAAGVGAPHIRQRLFWVAHSNEYGRDQRREGFAAKKHDGSKRNGSPSWLANGSGSGLEERQEQPTRQEREAVERSGDVSRMANAPSASGRAQSDRRHVAATGPQWDCVEYIPCSDGKARPVKPGVRLLAYGIPGRVAQLRGLGNAIVPQVAAEFVAAVMDSIR